MSGVSSDHSVYTVLIEVTEGEINKQSKKQTNKTKTVDIKENKIKGVESEGSRE